MTADDALTKIKRIKSFVTDHLDEKSSTFRPQPIYCIHTPKTGGTSVSAIIASALIAAYGEEAIDKIFQYGIIPYHNYLGIFERQARPRLVSGHFPSSFDRNLARLNPYVILTVRDPRDRFISRMDHYFRAMRTGGLTEQQNEVFRPFFEALQSDSLSESILMDELRKLRSIDNSIHASPILETQMYRRKIGVDAIIDTKDIARFTTSLESFVSHSLGHAIDLKSVSRQNTEPHEFFSRFSSEQVSLIKHCVAESYPDELNVVNAVRCLYPSILNHSTWNSFLKSLFSGIPSIRFG